jgi:hypothetical protein
MASRTRRNNHDPRNELAFQTQLNDYAQTLRNKGGGVTKAWTPGPAPPEWGDGYGLAF